MAPVYPVNPISPVAVVLFVVIAVIEAAFDLSAAGLLGGQAGVGWRIAAIEDWAFSPLVWDQVAARGNRSLDMLRRFVTYAFVHANLTQALFGGALLLALGKFVGDVFSSVAVAAVFFAGVVAGAVAFGIALDRNLPLVGCYPGVYGLIGAFTYILWLRLGRAGENQLRAFRLIGVLMALQLLFALLFGGYPSWIADVAGFVAGFAISPLVAPGGWGALVRRLRQR
jgi:membrane associated rhomboid family serine protease